MEPRNRRHHPIRAAGCAALMLLSGPVLAQTAPAPGRVVPEAPGAPPAPPGPRIPERIEPAPGQPQAPGVPPDTPPYATPGTVPPVDNVIRPPAGIDPGIRAPAPIPDPNTTPVIPPPAPMPRPQ